MRKYQKSGTCKAPFEMCCDEHIVLAQLRQGRKVEYELKDVAAAMLEEAGKTERDFQHDASIRVMIPVEKQKQMLRDFLHWQHVDTEDKDQLRKYLLQHLKYSQIR